LFADPRELRIATGQQIKVLQIVVEPEDMPRVA
jgi:hypothetical protein